MSFERLQPFKIGLSDEPPGSHNVVVEPLVDEPKEKTLDGIMVSSEEESTDLPLISESSKRPITASRLAGTTF